MSSSSDRNVPSSLAALLHGTLAAVGMWPARCACSCGRCAGASSRPAYSSGLRTSTRFLTPIASTVSSRNARIEWSCSCAVYDVRLALGQLVGQLAGVELPLLAPAVEQLDVLVAVELEVPVGVGGEPVVVAAVEHDGVVVGDAPLGQQRLELLLVDEVAADLVLQVGLPVELDRALDVALVVGRGVLVDLDQDDAGGVEVVLHPLGGDERVVAGHVWCLSVGGDDGYVASASGGAGRDPTDEQVHLAAQAEPEDGVEQRGHQGEAGGDQAEQVRGRRRSRPVRPARRRDRRPGRTAAVPRPPARSAGPGGAGPRSGRPRRAGCAARRARRPPRTSAAWTPSSAGGEGAGCGEQHHCQHDAR